MASVRGVQRLMDALFYCLLFTAYNSMAVMAMSLYYI